jgi:hypothetical protein
MLTLYAFSPPMRTHSLSTIALIVSSMTLFAACGKTPSKPVDKAQQIQNYTTVSKSGTGTVDPVHGAETGFWYGALTGTNGTNANGVAFVRTYADSATMVTVNLNILPAMKGKHYQTYLTDGVEGHAVDMGELRSIVGDARHSLTFDSKNVAETLRTVIITLDEKEVAEGAMKTPSSPKR